MAIFAQLERELIGQRTREGLAIKRSQGVKLGRKQSIPNNVAQAVRSMRDGGMTLRAIADQLNADDVPTGQGGTKWFASTVSFVLNREVVA